MKRILYFKRRLLKIILKILGVGSIGLMVSCTKYGAQTNTINMQLNGTVVSQDSVKAIEDIQVEVKNCFSNSKVITNNNGVFKLYPTIDEFENKIYLKISDIDGNLNGNFLSKDTVLSLTSEEKNNRHKQNIDIKLIRNE